jgi:hypothetical protein
VLTLEDATVFISDLTITGGESGIETRFSSAVTVTRSRITGNGAGSAGFGHITPSESAVVNNEGVGSRA